MTVVRIAAIGSLATVILGATALYYLQSRISTVTDHPYARIRSEPFVLRSVEIETRAIDLGFSRFSLPEAVAGGSVQVRDSLFVSFHSENGTPTLIACPIASERTEGIRELEAQFRRLFRDDSLSWFEIHRRVLQVQPFDVFGAIRKGREASIRDLTLLVIRGVLFGAARDNVRVFENEKIGAFVYRGDAKAFVQIHDKKAGVSQFFLVSPDADDLDGIASTLFRTYRAESDSGNKTQAQLLEQLRATGIPNMAEASAVNGSNEKQKTETTTEEIPARRIEQSR